MATAAFAMHAGRPASAACYSASALCVNGPAFDNLETMSKFLCLGMALPDIVRAMTVTPAGLLGMPELGSLAPGTTGDATVLRITEGACTFTDVLGEQMQGERRLALDSVVLGGALWHTAEPV